MDQLYLLGPEIILTVFALVVLAVDLLSDEKGRTWSPWLSLVGMVLAVSAVDAEALSALAALGYSVMEAQRALAASGDGVQTVEEKVLSALRYLGGA